MNYAVIGFLEGEFTLRKFVSYGDARLFEATLEAAGASGVDLFDLRDADLPF